MAKNELDKYRDSVMVHLTYIREKVDRNHDHLEKVNGRLGKTENSIIAIKTIGTTITVVIGIILTWLGIDR